MLGTSVEMLVLVMFSFVYRLNSEAISEIDKIESDNNNNPLSCSQQVHSLLSSISLTSESEFLSKYEFTFVVQDPGQITRVEQFNFTRAYVSTIHIMSSVSFDLEFLRARTNLQLSVGPSIFIFPCLKSEEFYYAFLEIIAAFYEADFKHVLWHPIFVLVHPSQDSIKNQDIMVETSARNLSVESDVFVLYTAVSPNQSISSSSPSWILKEYYSIRSQLFAHELELGNSEGVIPFQRVIQGKTLRRSNFEKATVIAVADDDPDYQLASKFKPGTLELESGFEVLIYKYLRDALNFTEAAIKANGYIGEGENGHLTGVSLQVIHDGDVAIGAAEFLEYRMKGPDGITYIMPTFYGHIYAYFKQPCSNSVRNIFTQTFTTWLWISVFSLWIFIIIVLKLTVKFKRKGKSSSFEDETVAKDSILWAASTICQQGWHISPSSASTRIIFFSGIFTGLISYVAYTAALVSILSVEVKPIQNFLDLIRENFFMASDNHIPTAKVIVKSLEESNLIPALGAKARNVEIEEHIDKLVKSKFAIVTISDAFYPIIQQMNYTEGYVCSTISYKLVSPRPLKSSCVVRRGSPLRGYLNYKMIQLHERGIREKRIKDYVFDTSIQCLQNGQSFHEKLGPRDVFTAYVLLSGGFLISFIGLVAEHFVQRLQNNLNTKNVDECECNENEIQDQNIIEEQQKDIFALVITAIKFKLLLSRIRRKRNEEDVTEGEVTEEVQEAIQNHI